MTRKAGVVIASVVVLGAVSVCALVGAVFCAATLHVPRKLGSKPVNATEVSITAADGARLQAWWLPAGKSNGNCVVVLHGIGDSRVGSVGFAPLFLNEGYSVLAPDSRAHGASEGRFVTYGLVEKFDVIAWTEWMKRAGCGKVYGLGESLGASVLIQAAEVRSTAFAAIVAECPYADLIETAEYRVGGRLGTIAVGIGVLYARLVYGLDFRQVSPIRSIPRTSTPILLIHGLSDFRTPPSNSIRLAAANPRVSLWLVPNAPHTGAASTEPEEFRRRVLDWFAGH